MNGQQWHGRRQWRRISYTNPNLRERQTVSRSRMSRGNDSALTYGCGGLGKQEYTTDFSYGLMVETPG